MKKGGYKIIDFKGTPITTSAVTIKGIHKAIESTNKRTVVSGLVKSGVEYDDFDCLFTSSSNGSFVGAALCGAQKLTITVTSADSVTVALGA